MKAKETTEEPVKSIRSKPSPIREFAKLLAIPIVLLLVISAYVYIPRLLADPQYDFIYSTCNGYRCSSTYTVNLSGMVSERITNDYQSYSDNESSLYYFDIDEDSSRKISLQEAQSLKLNSNSKSPDGYKIKRETSRGGFLLFYDYDSSWALVNGQKKKAIDIESDYSYYSDNVDLVGWVE